MKITRMLIPIILILVSPLIAFGHASYTGYSGAPGSNGTCAMSCHGHSGGTIEISGFPESYIPGETYEVMVVHNGGNAIRQFNGSCRIGSGSENAGVISSGTNTATYSTSHETNGIHLSSSNQNDGSFNWTAPSEGTGEVRLYIAGLQGSYSGSNTALVISSFEQTTGLDDSSPFVPDRVRLAQNYPNPFNAGTTIEFELTSPGHVQLTIYDLTGRKVEVLADEFLNTGYHSLVFDASSLSSGVYFYRLQTGETVETRRMVLLK